nr:MAG TPA: hypothetical protein [Caudoviricetes sp.]
MHLPAVSRQAWLMIGIVNSNMAFSISLSVII